MKLLRSIILTLLLLSLVACQPKTSIPSARYGAKMIFDPVVKRAILFGGRSDGIFGLKYYDDLWAFDTQSQRWERIKTDFHPDGRLSPGMVYDPENHQIIMFGGHTKENRVGDTWVYDIAANRWEEITPALSPSPRSDMGMIYDEVNRVVILFSGYCRDDFRQQCDDTWLIDTLLRTSQKVSMHKAPSPRVNAAIAYDSFNDLVILFGGFTEDRKSLQDTWIFLLTDKEWRSIQ